MINSEHDRISEMIRIVEDFRVKCLGNPEMITDGNNWTVGRSLQLISALRNMPMFTAEQRGRIIEAALQSFRESFCQSNTEGSENAESQAAAR